MKKRQLILGLPLALSALLTACGGGTPASDSSAPRSGLRTLGGATQVSEIALTPVAATTSSAERGDLGASAAIDGNESTRWSSGFSDDQFLTLDFGASVAINHVRIIWENAHATEYELQVSDDNRNWSTIKSVQNSQGGTEDWNGLSGVGRYLRMKGLKRSSQYGYSIFEIQAFSGEQASPPPPQEPIPQPSGPSTVLKPVAATSSPVENAGLSAAAAIDGLANTRWASARDNGAWIQFDFGAKTSIGYMKLVWENAYGKQYALMASDDGQAWTQVRLVNNGRGGTEEFFNLGISARYIRMQGIERATQYGYSLFEAEFKSPGSDNTIAPGGTSAFAFPANGDGLLPLPSSAAPQESLQFTLPDGTLVTRFGARGFARHGRERGEDWNEIGYGPNETVDPATGQPVDKGPGNYLTFVPQYFKNRTWGVEIIDNSRVPGVTKPTLVVNQYTTVDFLSGGIAFFRAIDRPGVTGYGWMAPGQLVDGSIKVCKPTAYPAAGQLAAPGGINGGCTLLVKQYPGMSGLDANGFPNGTHIPSRPLVVGDVIEVSPSMFSTTESMLAKGDSGGIRYYSQEWTYVVGDGLRPWYGVQPRLNSVPLPAETLSGGLGSVSYNYSDNGLFMFQQPHNNIGMQNMQRFVEGRRLLHTNFTTGAHNESGNDRYEPAIGLQGQRFNQSACIACHVNNGRSPAPIAVNQRLDNMSVRVAVTAADGAQSPHPLYGSTVQMNAVSANGTPQNWGLGVRVGGFETRSVKLADGSSVELRKPTLAFEGVVPDMVSLRAAQPMLGTGLLEAVPEADILARVRTTPDEDGVKGSANFVFDPESGAVRLGRFGWKASKASLRHQAAAALLQDMAVTSPVYPNRNCASDPVGCKSAPAQRGVSEPELQLISQYLALVAVPAQRSLPSGFPKGVAPLDEHRVDPQQISVGSKLFQAMRCSACHTVEMKTGPGHLLAELRNQTIRPYSDLLLHDMGSELADKVVEGQAKGNMWRTAPLWGIGYTEKVMGNSAQVGYLHDGRARNLTEAVMWHGGEASRSRDRFAALPKSDREALLAFLRSL
ncbi:di-heme oxidoredictase family protein [Pseudoduganella guangdongensis]|uniref:di-heme oxidoredictase family protein n=1 Tax=Pseudoduganella guangdongensis TaxID=2692179 RepID=UPI001927F52B|nr:di-heme oxidoredictase family protein [Pseudoduganella guangdongensis]